MDKKIEKKLLSSIKNYESEGNKVSDSTMFYYCPWYTGKK